MLSALRRYLADPVADWRTGSPQSQVLTLVALLTGVTLCFFVSLASYSLMPFTAYFVWLLLGMLLLRFRPLVAAVGDHDGRGDLGDAARPAAHRRPRSPPSSPS